MADGLQELVPIDPMAVGTFDELLTAMARTSFGGRRLGEAADLLTTMVGDPECTVVATFDGDQCGALAFGQNQVPGLGIGASRAEAEQNALVLCQSRDPTCVIICSGCN